VSAYDDTERETTERAIIKSFGIDAPGSEFCDNCGMRHWRHRDCPPVIPLDTATWLDGVR
jgi:ribosomal protein L32